jgi:Holliday junction resolvase RusA-like endonuclease
VTERTFFVWIEPVGKARPRVTRSGHVYTPDATTVAEAAILAAYRAAYPRSKPHDGPVEIYVLSVFTPPASWPKWERALALDGLWPCYRHRIDCDNAAKTVLDALEDDPESWVRGAYVNDRQVVELVTRKEYGATPHIYVRLTLIDEPARPKGASA